LWQRKAFRATSKRTRIETHSSTSWHSGQRRLSEQHPREQGLKPSDVITGFTTIRILSEQHPREQGLKRDQCFDIPDILRAFRATSKRTRIETWVNGGYYAVQIELSEQHPREQGLKHPYIVFIDSYSKDFQSNIQENKD